MSKWPCIAFNLNFISIDALGSPGVSCILIACPDFVRLVGVWNLEEKKALFNEVFIKINEYHSKTKLDVER